MNSVKTCPNRNTNPEHEILENIVQKLCKLSLIFMFRIHVCSFMCISVHACMSVEARGCCQLSFFITLYLIFFKTKSLNLELPNCIRLTGQ